MTRVDSDELIDRLSTARAAVVLTGAGISAESGLGTFRGPGGLWERFRVEDLTTPDAFAARPALVWNWYAERWTGMKSAEPNAGHRALARWESLFESFLLVTQNIDGLHQRAGSRAVVELHGTLARARCAWCADEIAMDDAIARPVLRAERRDDQTPRCACGGRYRPAVVWFGEMLPPGAFERAVEAVSHCDLFVSVGTSGTVYPAAGLISIAREVGALVVEVNSDAGAFYWSSGERSTRSVSLEGSAGAILPALTAALATRRAE